MASVTACLYFLTSCTTLAFCRGVTLQQMTVWHMHAILSSSSGWLSSANA